MSCASALGFLNALCDFESLLTSVVDRQSPVPTMGYDIGES